MTRRQYGMSDPIGTIYVERRAQPADDRAWKKTVRGWEQCDPPERATGIVGGEAEKWIPSDSGSDSGANKPDDGENRS